MKILTNGSKVLGNGNAIFSASDSYEPYPEQLWTPAELGDNLEAWYSPESVVLSQGRVVQSLDRSPNGRNSILLANPLLGPSLATNNDLLYQGSRNTGNFNSISILSSVLSIPQPFTICLRARIEGNADAPNATDYLFDGYDSIRTLVTISGNGTDDSEFAIGIPGSGFLFPVVVPRAMWKGIARTYTMVANGANSKFYIDNDLIVTGDMGAASLAGIRFGAFQGDAHGLNGTMSEQFIASAELLPVTIGKANTYLSRWS